MPPRRTDNPGAAGQLIGGNLLQQSIDRNTAAILELTKALRGQGQGAGGYPGVDNPMGPSRKPKLNRQQQAQADVLVGQGYTQAHAERAAQQAFPRPDNPFAGQSGYKELIKAGYSPAQATRMSGFPAPVNPFAGMAQTLPNQRPGVTMPTPWGAFNPPPSASAQPQPFGKLSFPPVTEAAFTSSSGPTFGSQLRGFAGGFLGGYAAGGGSMFRGGRGAGGGAPPGGGGGYAVLGGTLGAVAAGLTAFGASNFNNQVIASTFVQQGGYRAPAALGFNAVNANLRYGAFGANTNNVNAISFGTQDAAQGYLLQQYISGQFNPASTPFGRNVAGATSAFGYINPLGATGAAAMAGMFYSPQTSMNLRALGYPVTPRSSIGGPGAGVGQTIQGMLQAWYGRGVVSSQTLGASLSAGGKGTLNLQAAFPGATPQQISTMSSTMMAYNQLFQRGVSPTQADQELLRASKGDKGAQQFLQNRGISTTDLQKLMNVQAQQTARTSDLSSAFNSGLAQATTLLTDFNKALTKLLNDTPLGSLIGFGQGFGGTLRNVVGGLGGGLLGGGIAALLTRGADGLGGLLGKIGGGIGGLFSRIFGGGRAAAGDALRMTKGADGVWKYAGEGASGFGRFLGPIGGILGGILPFLSGSSRSQMYNYASKTDPGRGGVWNPFNWFGAWAQQLNPFKNLLGGPGGGAAPTQPQAKQATKKTPAPTGGGVSGAAITAVTTAEKFLGTPYVWGGDSPATGFDCSGLVEYAYGQAGVHLPRTSEEQWAFLSGHRKAVPLNRVQEGDLVFAEDGAQGQAGPGHVGMMISRTALIQAPHTGANVEIIGFNPGAWTHAGRPSGGMAGINTGAPGPLSSGGQPLPQGPGHGAGNKGSTLGASEKSSLISTGELQALFAGGPGALGSGTVQGHPVAAAAAGKGTPAGLPGKPGATTANLSGNKKIMNQWAARFGWGVGAEWTALDTLEMHEAGYSNTAQNPSSTAYGMGQFLDTTWATVGGSKTSDPNLQAKYMMEYIKQRYGDPIHAWAQYFQHPGGQGSYAKGTRNAMRGLALVGENGPEIMPMHGGETVYSNSESRAIMRNMMTPQVNIRIEKGAIVVNGAGSTGTGTDASAAGRQIAQSLLAHLDGEKIYQAIGYGQKN